MEDIGIDFLVGNDDGHRPTGALDGRVEHVLLLTLVPDQAAALFTGEHSPGYFQRGIVSHVLRNLLKRVIHDQRRSRTHHQVARSAGHDAVRTGIFFDAAHLVGEPVQGDIGRQDAGDAAHIVRHGDRVGRHHHLAATLVIVGFGPVSAPLLQGFDKPFLRQVVIGLGPELGGVDLLPVTEGIGGIEPSFLREIVFRKGDGRSVDDLVIVHHAHVHDPEGIRHAVDHPPEEAYVVAHGRLHLVHHVVDPEVGGFQLVLRAPGGLLENGPPGEIVLDEGCRLQRGQGDDDHRKGLHQGPLPGFVQFSHGFKVEGWKKGLPGIRASDNSCPVR